MDLSEKKNPIGIDDYKKLMDENYFYIDKTLLIKEFWNDGSSWNNVTQTVGATPGRL